ncbi:type IX secretion system PorP/SprF family membrane protein [Winogradskyella eximia]|jgi:type IX secretion system PorP/SprF family membrane protein|uniref:Type IX secretion system PorP/SprF family membrane protein n=1 Tax=Winogradskyella eximia TaxID=262006 RepID=A0A3D9H1T1_9FLAO|nr:type IX secretion system membrane protein PorP/SprF [Winogradskyella eximia]RED42816.1 type IX secretion system PorP/SprF family membrane protein [Winogradskyella eximia]|tara:strand:- start:973 stop:1899 length:927 start_codon:yes stop_codon:yes gene_type:complete
MIHKSSLIKGLIVLVFILISTISFAQQDPQYTHYMFNTLSVNPAYAGQRETLSVVGLHRSQWVGINGAPQTQSLSIHSPLRNERIGLGLNIVNDALGPASESFVDANFSYTIPLNADDLKLSFGAKGGFHMLDTDWSKGRFRDTDPAFENDLNLISPMVGAGLYMHTRKWYLGLAVPNFIETKHYDDYEESVATERMHFYLIGGYVFNISETTEVKPAFLLKGVSGAPIIADVSANFWFQKKVTLGLAWRWDDSVSALAGFQITPGMFVGYSYDMTTTGLSNYNNGSHELTLRFEVKRLGRILSPRFF